MSLDLGYFLKLLLMVVLSEPVVLNRVIIAPELVVETLEDLRSSLDVDAVVEFSNLPADAHYYLYYR